jgi:hypothetical protein
MKSATESHTETDKDLAKLGHLSGLAPTQRDKPQTTDGVVEG